MPNFSGVWNLKEQIQAIANETPVSISWRWGSNTFGVGGGTTSPAQFDTVTNWASLGPFDFSPLAIKPDGSLWARGYNGKGQLGIGNTTSITGTSFVQVGALTEWAQVSSSYHALAIKTNGTLWSWGYNIDGSVGDGTNISRSSPVQVGALTNWSYASAGRRGSAAIKTDSTLWTWGGNGNGQLGQNSRISRSSPVQVGTDWAKVRVTAVNQANFMLGVKTNGTLWAWGENARGNLGQNDTNISRSSPVQVGSLSNWSQIAPGSRYGHSVAVKTDGTLWTWGDNSHGQLGQGNVILRSSPVQVGALTNWSKVSAGERFAGALKTDGTIWTWGINSYGRLGDGTAINRSSPVQVGSENYWTEIQLGFNAATALGGVVKRWPS